jgi:hypothetical protein
LSCRQPSRLAPPRNSNRTIAKGHISKTRCNFCGRNLTKDDEEEYGDDSKGLNYEVQQACSSNSSNTINTIEYLLICLDCMYHKHHMDIYGLQYVMEENMS